MLSLRFLFRLLSFCVSDIPSWFSITSELDTPDHYSCFGPHRDGREVSAASVVFWILCLGLCLSQLLRQRPFRYRGVEQSEFSALKYYFVLHEKNHLQTSLISHLKNKLEFHVWLIRFSVRTKRPWSCLGLGCHFSARCSHCGWLGVDDLLNIPFINKLCIIEYQTDNFHLFIGIWINTSLISTWDVIQIVTLLQFIMLTC